MKIPMYILGVLKRFGPQHGYQIKKIFSERISDFTQIKLPVIYYHLEKMQQKGLLSSQKEKQQNKIEKTVYSITNKGESEFHGMLKDLYDFEYRPDFLNDALLFFMDSLKQEEFFASLETYIVKLEKGIHTLNEHKKNVDQFLPEDAKTMSACIFDHHECHYKAELLWAEEVLKKLRQGEK